MRFSELTNRQKSKLIGLLVFIVIIFLASLSSKAQVNLRLKGYKIEQDSAVVLDLKYYRQARQKMILADSAILHLENRILNQNKLIDLLQEETRNLIAQTSLQNEFIQSSKIELAEIKRGISELKNLPDQKIPFYKQDWFLILAGGLVVVAVVK